MSDRYYAKWTILKSMVKIMITHNKTITAERLLQMIEDIEYEENDKSF